MAMPDETPVASWTRLDLLAVVAKWIGSDPGQLTHMLVMAALLVAPVVALVLRRKQKLDDGLGGLTGALILSAMLVSLYHQSYDALLLLAPLTGLVVARLEVWRSLPVLANPDCRFVDDRAIGELPIHTHVSRAIRSTRAPESKSSPA